jgi:hypothetical protein
MLNRTTSPATLSRFRAGTSLLPCRDVDAPSLAGGRGLRLGRQVRAARGDGRQPSNAWGRTAARSRSVVWVATVVAAAIAALVIAVLGLIWGGLLLQAGDTRAGRVLGFVALGVGVVLLSKPIAA